MMDTSATTSAAAAAKNNNSSSKMETHCPYAIALHSNHAHHHNGGDDSSVHTDGSTSTDLNHDAMGDSGHGGVSFTMADIKSCPAFAETGSCPFAKPHSAGPDSNGNSHAGDSMQETLQKIPPSHFDPQGKFFKIIQELHLVHGQIQENVAKDGANSNDIGYHLPGGCPVQPVVKRANKDERVAHVSFTEAMESWSLAAIMARLAKEQGLDMDADADEEEPSESHPEEVTSSDHQEKESLVTPADATTPTVDRPSLAQALKAGTAVSHQAAEDVHFVRNFIQGKIDRQIYGEMVGMLYHVYVKLEACLDQAGPKHFGTLHFPLQLSRQQALEEDLDFWHGSHVDKDSAGAFQTPAVQDYMDRLDYLLEHDPLLLLAHSYTRYLGDLSGGKILARVARRALDLQEDGLAFYEFAHVPSAKRFKDTYRQAMDAMPLTAHQVVKLVAEANVAFLLNMRLFEELDVMANVPGASVRPLAEVLAYAELGVAGPVVDTKAAAAEAECPFMIGKMKAASAKAEAATTHQSAAATATAGTADKKRCPWPFILAHDPVDGLRDWQTWAVAGLLLCWMWTRLVVAQQPAVV